MLKLIDENYYKINFIFILIVAVYCMCGLIVPLQFISANKIITGGMTLLGLFLAGYNLIIKKVYLKVRSINYLILFFIFNVLTCILVANYGYSTNIKNIVVFIIYFFAIFPMFKLFRAELNKKIYYTFFYVIAVLNTIGVSISIAQFILLKGYRVHDYRGKIIRQGFVESRLFGIFADPNYLSITSLIVIIFLIVNLKKIKKNYTVLTWIAILLNYIYVVLSGSRTAYICLMIVSLVYAIMLFYRKEYPKTLLKVIAVLAIVFFSYKSIGLAGVQYLSYNKEELIKHQGKLNNENNLSLERTDTSEDNISNNRFTIWKSTLNFVPKRPVLGYSSGNWYEIAKKYNSEEYIVKEHYFAHNGYIEILFYNGVVGFLIMAIFILTTLKSLGSKIMVHLRKGSIVNVELMAISLILIVILISNLFLSSTFYGITLLGMILFISISYYFNMLSTDGGEE
ncbi:O-antigen ligase family protein [Gemella cuniculi]|uniref:O-antigen ligase family protein n=1 Tax=Gemella cuniculi TaxID=150240 RepID=UPI0004069007|nr:O-antigen ligase family protein [Gemella cuniculi]